LKTVFIEDRIHPEVLVPHIVLEVQDLTEESDQQPADREQPFVMPDLPGSEGDERDHGDRSGIVPGQQEWDRHSDQIRPLEQVPC